MNQGQKTNQNQAEIKMIKKKEVNNQARISHNIILV